MMEHNVAIYASDAFKTGLKSGHAAEALELLGEESGLASFCLGFDVDGLRVRTSNMLYQSAHVSCSVERRGVPSQQFQVRTCFIDDELVALELVRRLSPASAAVSAALLLPDSGGIELRLDAVPTLLNADLPGTKASMQRILAAAAEHVRGHTVALAAALPGLLADAEAIAPPPSERPPVPRRPAVPVASPFAATRPPAGLHSPSSTPSKVGGSGADGCGGDLPSARRSSVTSHAEHARLLPRFDSEAGSSAALGGSHGFGSLELPAQDSQQLSGFDRIDSMRMPSFSDNFRTTRAASGHGDRCVASGLVFSSARRPSDLDGSSPMLPSFMQRRHGPGGSAAAPYGDAGAPSRPAGNAPPTGSPAALGRAGSSSTARPQSPGLGGLMASGRESSHSLQHYLDDSQAAAQPPREVVIAPGMGCLLISPPAQTTVLAAAPPPAAPADVDAAPRHLRLDAVEALGLEAEGRSLSLGSAGSQSLSGFSAASARTPSHGSVTLEGALDSVPSLRGTTSMDSTSDGVPPLRVRTSMQSAPEVEPVWC